MPPIEKKLHRPQEAPPAGFAGRPALISSLLGPGGAERSREEELVLAGAIVRESMMQLAGALKSLEAFDARISGLAPRVLERRRMQEAEKPAAAECGRPSSLGESLSAALLRIGTDAQIIGEKRGDGMSFFIVRENGSESKVPLRDSILASDDPVAEAEKVARMLAVGRSRDDSRKEMLMARRATRPPAAPLGIGEDDLDRRKMTYDGVIGKGGKLMFTYLVEGMETTFTAPSGLRGKELLAYLDSWVFGAHTAYRKPLDAQVCEAIAGGASPGMDDGQRVANTLRRFVLDGRMADWLVPWEYRDAFMELRASREYSDRAGLPGGGALTAEEKAAFATALSMLADGGRIGGRALENVRAAFEVACGPQPPGAEEEGLGRMLERINSAASGLQSLLAGYAGI